MSTNDIILIVTISFCVSVLAVAIFSAVIKPPKRGGRQ